MATARARREEQEALERLAKARRSRGSNSFARSVRTARSSHSVRSAISSELLQAPPALPAPQAPQTPQAPTGLTAQPMTAVPLHLPELPTAQSSWLEWFAAAHAPVAQSAVTNPHVSVRDRVAELERAQTRFGPASDHGHEVQRFLDERDWNLQSARVRVQELESMIKRQGSRKSFESVVSRDHWPRLVCPLRRCAPVR